MGDTWPCSDGESCEQMIASFFSDLTAATLQLRLDQEEQLHRYSVRMDTLMERFTQRLKEEEKWKEFSESPLISAELSSLYNERGVWDTREVEMTPLSHRSTAEMTPYSHRSTDGSTISLGLGGPTTEQIALVYSVPNNTRSFFFRTRSFSRRLLNCQCARFVRTSFFAFCSTMLIIGNSMFIGFMSHYVAVHKIDAFHNHNGETPAVQAPTWAHRVELCFTFAFTVELLLRLIAEDLSFCFGNSWAWNMLDTTLVGASLIELCLSLIGVNSANVSSSRLLRLLRMLRTFRSIRILRYLRIFSKFRLLTLAISNSVVPFIWACAMVLWMLYLVSILFLHGVSDYVGSRGADAAKVVTLQALFGGLDRSVLTLFMTITGGMSWDEVFDALLQIHFGYAFLLVFFIAVMALAGLNIIAGIFVNDAIEMAQMDRDIVIQTETEKNRAMVKELVVLFEEFDTDKTGTLTLRELTEAWTNPEVSARFRILGVEHMDAAALFRTLDVDESEEIDIKEFVTGCLRARTLTRPVDFETFIRETKRGARRHQHHFNYVVKNLNRLLKEVSAVTSVMNDVNKDASGRSRRHFPDDVAGMVGHVSEENNGSLSLHGPSSRVRLALPDDVVVFPGVEPRRTGSLSRGRA